MRVVWEERNVATVLAAGVVGGLPWVFDVVGVGLPALASWLMTEKGGRGRRQGRPVERAVLSVLLVA